MAVIARIDVVPFVKRLEHESIGLVVDDLVEQYADKKTAKQIAEYSESAGADSEVVRALKSLKVANDAELYAAIKEVIAAATAARTPLRGIDASDVAGLAAKHGVSNRELGKWRRSEILRCLKAGPASEADLAARVYSEGDALSNLLNKMIAEGAIVKQGDMYAIATE
ncbi:MAG: hypothetical protein WD768_23270 [Phycisphaeraceae bacterium]